MKIGIIQCCSVMPQFQKEFGNYPEMFIQLFKEIDATLQFEIYDIRENQYPNNLSDCDAYITTGSRVSTYDAVDWIPGFKQLIIDIHQAQIKLVGICFGHQLIADCLGGKTLKSDAGWGVGVAVNDILIQKKWMKLPDISSSNYEAPSALKNGQLSQLNIIVSHKDQVAVLPENTEVLASSTFCPNFMLQFGDNILTLQGHPEFSKAYSETLMRFRTDIIGQAGVENGIKSLSLEVHDRLIMVWIYQFMFRSDG